MTTEHRTACADRVDALAADPRFARRADDLTSLAEELRDQDAGLAATWVGVNLFQAFPAEETVTAARASGLERVLGVTAGISVFLPVAWTWWSFHQASSAYERLISDGVDQTGTTFLSWWTTGFDGRLDGVHRLVPMSVVSVILIVVAIVLVAGQRMAANRAMRLEDAADAAAGAELASVLTTAQRVLNGSRVDDPKHLQNVVRTSVRQLLKAHEATEAGAHEIQVASRQMAEALTPAITALTAAGTQAATAAGAVEKAGTSLSTTVAATESGVREAVSGLTALVEGQTVQLRQATESAIQQAGAAEAAATAHLMSSVDRLTETQGSVAGEVSSLGDTTRAHATDTTALLGSLRDAVAALEQTLSMTESAMQAQASELSQAHDSAERMLRHLERLQSPVAVS